MKKYIFFLFLIFFFSNVTYSYAYDINKLQTTLVVKENGYLEISDKVIINGIKNNEVGLSFNLPLSQILDVQSSFETTYSYENNILNINLKGCCLSSLELKIVYLTNQYTKSYDNIFSIDYTPLLREYVDEFSITFLENTQILNISGDYENLGIIDNKFVYEEKNFLNKFLVEYFIFDNFNFEKENKNILLKYLIIFFLLISLFILFFLKNKKIKKTK